MILQLVCTVVQEEGFSTSVASKGCEVRIASHELRLNLWFAFFAQWRAWPRTSKASPECLPSLSLSKTAGQNYPYPYPSFLALPRRSKILSLFYIRRHDLQRRTASESAASMEVIVSLDTMQLFLVPPVDSTGRPWEFRTNECWNPTCNAGGPVETKQSRSQLGLTGMGMFTETIGSHPWPPLNMSLFSHPSLSVHCGIGGKSTCIAKAQQQMCVCMHACTYTYTNRHY